MFSFDAWSSRVYELVDLIEVERKNSDTGSAPLPAYQVELQKLWKELRQCDDDKDVWFFNKFLDNARDAAKGVLTWSQCEEILLDRLHVEE